MRSYLFVSIAVVGCCVCSVGGYAVGAYMQFLHTFAAKQDIFVRDITTARGLAKSEDSDLLDWVRADAPLQYQFLTGFEAIRSASLPIKLVAVTRMTWGAKPSEALRSPDRWQKMMRDCECGLVLPDSKL
jgi:hypothetical protein